MILDYNLVTALIMPVFAFFVVGAFIGAIIGFLLSWLDQKKNYLHR